MGGSSASRLSQVFSHKRGRLLQILTYWKENLNILFFFSHECSNYHFLEGICVSITTWAVKAFIVHWKWYENILQIVHLKEDIWEDVWIAILPGNIFQCRYPSNAVTTSVKWQKHLSGRKSHSIQIAGFCVCKDVKAGTTWDFCIKHLLVLDLCLRKWRKLLSSHLAGIVGK